MGREEQSIGKYPSFSLSTTTNHYCLLMNIGKYSTKRQKDKNIHPSPRRPPFSPHLPKTRRFFSLHPSFNSWLQYHISGYSLFCLCNCQSINFNKVLPVLCHCNILAFHRPALGGCRTFMELCCPVFGRRSWLCISRLRVIITRNTKRRITPDWNTLPMAVVIII